MSFSFLEYWEEIKDSRNVCTLSNPCKSAKLQVFLNGHFGEEFTLFRDQRQPTFDHLVCRKSGNFNTLKKNMAFPFLRKSEDTLDERGFSSAIGAKERDNLPFVYDEGYIPEYLET